MIYRGQVRNGVIHLQESVALPEGADVEVRLVDENERQRERVPDDESQGEVVPTLYETLKDFAGRAEGLPSDAAVNLDHYLYGLPKRQ